MPALAAVARLPGMHVCFVLESSSSGQVCACMTMLGGGGWLLGPSGPAVELVPLAKSKTLRILEAKRSGKGMLSLRQVTGGWLAQESDDLTPEDITFTKMSERTPGCSELSDAKFACLCVKHVKSNAIVIAKVSSARMHASRRLGYVERAKSLAVQVFC